MNRKQQKLYETIMSNVSKRVKKVLNEYYDGEDGVFTFEKRYKAKDRDSLRTFIYNYCRENGNDADLNFIDVSAITDMSDLFANSDFCGDISEWDVSNVRDMSYMFDNATQFNGDLSRWDVSNVVNMERMFGGAISFNGDISAWNVSNVENMQQMFYNAASFNSPLASWDVSNVRYMNDMFNNATSFNRPIGKWDVSAARETMNFRGMFFNAKNFDQNLMDWGFNADTVSNFAYGSALRKGNYPRIIEDIKPIKPRRRFFR